MNRSSSTEGNAYQQERAGAKAQKVKGTTSSQDGKSLGGPGGLGNVRRLGRWTTRRLAGEAGALDLVPVVAENLKCDWSKLRCAACKMQSRF